AVDDPAFGADRADGSPELSLLAVDLHSRPAGGSDGCLEAVVVSVVLRADPELRHLAMEIEGAAENPLLLNVVEHFQILVQHQHEVAEELVVVLVPDAGPARRAGHLDRVAV